MTKRIRTSEATLGLVRDAGPSMPRIEATQVQEALGAEAPAEGLIGVLAPISLFALRDELARRLQSSGGRPALSGTTRRAKIPLSDQEWLQLEELAAAVSSPGFAPSAGQVASVLLTLSLRAVAARLAESPSGQSRSALVRELTALTAREPAQD